MSNPRYYKANYEVGDIVVWDMDYVGNWLRAYAPHLIDKGPFEVVKIINGGYNGVNVRELGATEIFKIEDKNGHPNDKCFKKDPFMSDVVAALATEKTGE